MIEVRSLEKKFLNPEPICVLQGLNFSVAQGTWASLTGPSGSGKSTLLTLLAGLDVPTQGEVWVDGQCLSSWNEERRALFRAQHLGFVFQNFRLFPTLNAEENIRLPFFVSQKKVDEKWIENLIERVGLQHRRTHFPKALSGGEAQRVAVARAFALKPKILFADEPTGNLDSQNGQKVLQLFEELQKEVGSTLIVVTHEESVAARASQRIRLRDGHLVDS